MNSKTTETWRSFHSDGMRTACWAKKSQAVDADMLLNEGVSENDFSLGWSLSSFFRPRKASAKSHTGCH